MNTFGKGGNMSLMKQFKIKVWIGHMGEGILSPGEKEKLNLSNPNGASISAEECPMAGEDGGARPCMFIDELHDDHGLCPNCCGFEINTVFCRYKVI